MTTAISETPEAGQKFVRGLGLLDSTMLVAGSMIGSGIFIVSSIIARQVGSPGWLLVVWIVTGLLTLTAALSYGELAAMMPKAGGQYVYLREAFSPLWGFLYGWTLFLVIQTGTIAAVAVGFARYSGVLVPWLSDIYEHAWLGSWQTHPKCLHHSENWRADRAHRAGDYRRVEIGRRRGKLPALLDAARKFTGRRRGSNRCHRVWTLRRHLRGSDQFAFLGGCLEQYYIHST